MTYLFKCDKCQKTEYKSIPMDDYEKEKDNQKCECGSKMSRVIEFNGKIGLCNGMYGTGNGGWNK